MIKLKSYKPHDGQYAFHYAVQNLYRYVAMVCGIRGGKTYSGAREAGAQAWNSRENGVYGIIAPTYQMLKRTTWREFKIAVRPLIKSENTSDKIITFKNGREVHGFSADKPDRIRNATLCGFWLDEGRECKAGIWDVLLGRVLSTGGKGILTTSPNSFDWIHDVFVEQRDKDYGLLQFSTYENKHIPPAAIDDLARKYDDKFMQQELLGRFVVFQGQVYYAFNRKDNAGDLAFKLAKYDPSKPLGLCCDFNVNPLCWAITQIGENLQTGLTEAYVVDEISLTNSNTIEACEEFKRRYPNHYTGLDLYGDATGAARHSSSNVTNWKIVKSELAKYRITPHIPTRNPAQRDRVNAVNGLICNSRGERRVLVNPKCKKLIRDFEQVSYKEGTTAIDGGKDLDLTHMSDAFGYMVEKEFGLNKAKYEGLKI